MVCYAIYDNKGYGPAFVVFSSNDHFSPEDALMKYGEEVNAKIFLGVGALPTKEFASADIEFPDEASRRHHIYASKVDFATA